MERRSKNLAISRDQKETRESTQEFFCALYSARLIGRANLVSGIRLSRSGNIVEILSTLEKYRRKGRDAWNDRFLNGLEIRNFAPGTAGELADLMGVVSTALATREHYFESALVNERLMAAERFFKAIGPIQTELEKIADHNYGAFKYTPEIDMRINEFATSAAAIALKEANITRLDKKARSQMRLIARNAACIAAMNAIPVLSAIHRGILDWSLVRPFNERRSKDERRNKRLRLVKVLKMHFEESYGRPLNDLNALVCNSQFDESQKKAFGRVVVKPESALAALDGPSVAELTRMGSLKRKKRSNLHINEARIPKGLSKKLDI